MSLKIEEVQHIAKLAKLDLSDGEIARYREQLSDILDHIAKLNELDTSGISPMANVIVGASPLRADESRPSLPREKLLQNAPDAEKGQFKVPSVFGEKKK
ncbi:MAG: Asp-tRNA(Asn)/Glu-tRNA(Gln) amidotransferase subunit GatC [Anaerolineae bacterium]|jgi:aspartyl-tRNA(Asn)/glutamyl-tRNA(Gln) amidotransferase subunit C|nr:Asp-tRNA(Asn)/Glu-tRNA(Gln) amidotransferase subunit GatC [Anaerolineae bacterium]MBT3714309.1 Asp-tRNA(Asn)/Glu-tRNA(Gln) amidotransferase subunit GatC [Anaerolineae bacterium]MBT4312683.1 Asp-tRNA(Asn)/Glu-tRNA(Gln) amidotransferase subunit GatC [Anaerolineae bacterium]MBT4458586.1 Asp-tRNA(Asn)/Glu-tRNA(Gln) amidotransferase subunit GatC [Anaerolineae bacterium]MBT4843360.1 Asp-tRNA(Asn)/Glu-tRNA(Gln) amidotransferase subunit GatC [Anaerolineae bacterium]